MVAERSFARRLRRRGKGFGRGLMSTPNLAEVGIPPTVQGLERGGTASVHQIGRDAHRALNEIHQRVWHAMRSRDDAREALRLAEEDLTRRKEKAADPNLKIEGSDSPGAQISRRVLIGERTVQALREELRRKNQALAEVMAERSIVADSFREEASSSAAFSEAAQSEFWDGVLKAIRKGNLPNPGDLVRYAPVPTTGWMIGDNHFDRSYFEEFENSSDGEMPR